jgi:hypothetical protein
MNDREKYQAQHIVDHILFNCSLSSLKDRGIINDYDVEVIDAMGSMIYNIYVKSPLPINNVKVNFEIKCGE